MKNKDDFIRHAESITGYICQKAGIIVQRRVKMRHNKKVIGLMTALILSVGMFGSVPVHAESIWDLPGAPEKKESSSKDAEEYFINFEEMEAMRETVTEKDALTKEAQKDLLIAGPGSIYAKASGDTPGHWDDSSGYWMYWLANEGRWATNEWIKQGGDWYYLDGSGHMKSGFFWVGDSAYYCNASGVMQTGWQEIGSGKSRYYYFDANGAWLVTTDTIGCNHGILVLASNHYNFAEQGNIRYYSTAGSRYNSTIRNGVNLWNNATDLMNISEGNASNWNLLFQEEALGEGVVARTYMNIRGSYVSDPSLLTTNWSTSRVSFNSSGSPVSTTGAHEIGHVMGLSHHTDSRYLYRYDIMYPYSNNSRKITIYDVNVLGHLFEN